MSGDPNRVPSPQAENDHPAEHYSTAGTDGDVEMKSKTDAPPAAQAVSQTEGVDYTWEGLSYKVLVDVEETDAAGKVTKSKKWKPLVRDMTGTALRGRTLAIMGPSGAGKTTFLNTIAGRIRQDKTAEVEGMAFLNDTVLTNEYKKVISFVAQDDIVMGKETPREALYFNYRIKLNASDEEANKATDEMLERLHLVKCQNTLLGIPGLIKGVSGGEKKRTNIGSELITNPKILILDEPTTGLDSVNALRVGKLLTELAHNEGRTVLCTIHTPSSELFDEFDDILLLAKGRVAYHGSRDAAPAYFAQLGFPLPKNYNPSEFYMNVLQLDDVDEKVLDPWAKHVENTLNSENPNLQGGPDVVSSKDQHLLEHCKAQGCGYCQQLTLLTARSWRLVVRDPMSTVGRLVQTVFFSLLLGLFYLQLDDNSAGVQDRLGAIFMIAINGVFLSVMNGVATFPPERAVFLMEQTNDTYSAWMYYLAKTFAETPFQLFFPTIYTVIVYWMLGLHASAAAFFVALLVVIMTSNTSYSFGLLATALFPTAEVAMAFVPMMLMPMMIVSGLFANTERLEPAWVWLNYLSFPRYAFTGLCINEFERIDSLCDQPNPALCQYQNGNEVISFLGFSHLSWELSVLILAIMLIVFRVGGGFFLYMQGRGRRSNLSFKNALSTRDMSSPRIRASPKL